MRLASPLRYPKLQLAVAAITLLAARCVYLFISKALPLAAVAGQYEFPPQERYSRVLVLSADGSYSLRGVNQLVGASYDAGTMLEHGEWATERTPEGDYRVVFKSTATTINGRQTDFSFSRHGLWVFSESETVLGLGFSASGYDFVRTKD